jgi:hypothetical protein
MGQTGGGGAGQAGGGGVGGVGPDELPGGGGISTHTG